ncbi:hypothetical protein [Lentzea cavernae]|uniref:Secreted protein n=1 Tax=Lentzea cavernae TaxID=2020703 RepID=A0ABQ3MA94_9PSEU|nr:hypothetical protein [Lentzea cavernae]GHH35575.1 hypothetical protein GCM10017774_21020 [Lentzea cavernae]
MTRFITKNGKVIPLNGGGGGKKGAGVVVAGALALTVAAGTGGVTTIGGLGTAEVGSGGSSLRLGPRKAEGQKTARKGDAEGAWQRMGMRQLKRTARQQAECVAVSFGEVREFFTRNRCTSLDRVLFAVADGAGNTAVISVVWVGLASDSDARRFQSVMNRHGSGDITPLGSHLLDMAEIHFTGLRYGSDRDGRTVTVAEAETASGQVDDDTLDALAEVAAHLPRV